MSFHPNLFSEQTGLQYDKPSMNFWGTQSGFPVFVRYIPGRSSLVFLLYGKQPGADGIAEDSSEIQIMEQLNEWRMSRSGISALTYKKNCLSCIIALSAKDTDLNAINNFDAMVKLAAQLMLVPCCMSCGTQFGFSQYVLDDTGVSLCSSCAQETAGRLGQVQLEKQAEPVSHMGSAIGLVIGAVFLFAITFVGALVSLLLIKKLGRKITLLWGAIAVAVRLAVAVAVPVVEFASDIASFNQDERADAEEYCNSYDQFYEELATSELGTEEIQSQLQSLGFDEAKMKQNYERCKMVLNHQTTASCVADLTDLLKTETYKSVKGELIKCILWGVLSIIVGTAITLPRLNTEASGKHTFRELTRT